MLELEELTDHIGEAAGLMKLLANPHRLMILCTLLGDEASVSELNERVPLSQSALSQHLASLRSSQLVATRRQGQAIYYRVDHPVVATLVAALKSHYCPDR